MPNYTFLYRPMHVCTLLYEYCHTVHFGFAWPSLPHSRRVPGFALAKVSTDLGSKRRSRGAHGTYRLDQNVGTAWAVFEPRTYRLAVQPRAPYNRIGRYIVPIYGLFGSLNVTLGR